MKATHSRASAKNTRKASGEGSWAKARKRRERLPTGTNDDKSARIETHLAGKKWPEARALIQEQLVFHPEDHWLWMNLGLTYHEEKEYDKAMECSKRAVQLAPDCPLALWHYAGSLDMAGRGALALPIWIMLLRMEPEQVAYDDHGEGMEWALRLLNDVHYRIGRYYQWIGRNDLAAESYHKYLHNRRHGVASIYEQGKVVKYLRQVS
jgi:tetratricopeptide (TPR) repeat protein